MRAWLLVCSILLSACTSASNELDAASIVPTNDLAGVDLSGLDSASPGHFAAGTICNDSGTPRTPPSTLSHLVVVLLENENFGNVNGNVNAPYIPSLANDCGYSTSYLDNCFTD